MEPLIGRENEFEAIRGFIMTSLSREPGSAATILCICGSCGGGKTETVLRASKACEQASRLSGRRRLIAHYFNCVDVEPKGLAEMIGKACVRGQRQSTHLDHLVNGLEAVKTCSGQGVKAVCPVETPTPRFPLHLIVLDEADALRGFAGGTQKSYLHNLVLFALTNPLYIALVLVSNSRSFDVVPEKSRQDVLFEAYSAQALRHIAAGNGDNDNAVVISDAALEFAAKSAVANHGGDVRQLTTIVRRSTKIASAKRPREESASNVLQPTSVNVQHMAQASSSSMFRTSSILHTLPEQMLFMLCCCVRILRPKDNSVPSSKLETLSIRDVSMLYKKIMTAKSYPAVSQQGINDLLMNLADYGLITRPQGQNFTVSIDTGITELEGELIAIGAQSQPNRLKEVLSFQP